jgi:hypothetical protein
MTPPRAFSDSALVAASGVQGQCHRHWPHLLRADGDGGSAAEHNVSEPLRTALRCPLLTSLLKIKSRLEHLECLPVVSAIRDNRAKDRGEHVTWDTQPVSPCSVLPGLIDQAFAHVKDHSTDHNIYLMAAAAMVTLCSAIVLSTCQLQRGSGRRIDRAYLLPVVALVLGVLALGESVIVTVLAGIALVLVGVALTRRRPKPATDEG